MAKKRKNEEGLPTDDQVAKFEMLSGLLNSIFFEMKEFSKKKPDELLNKLKVTTVNKVLSQIKEILLSEPTVEFLELLDDETLPSNSDAVLIIGQFRAALNHFKERYYRYDRFESESRWFTKESP
jgi:response regulator RpfG family c-di-GMP phosphodiesterase